MLWLTADIIKDINKYNKMYQKGGKTCRTATTFRYLESGHKITRNRKHRCVSQLQVFLLKTLHALAINFSVYVASTKWPQSVRFCLYQLGVDFSPLPEVT